MTPEKMTPEEAHQEALRRIEAAREQRLTELDLTDLLWDDRIPFAAAWVA